MRVGTQACNIANPFGANHHLKNKQQTPALASLSSHYCLKHRTSAGVFPQIVND
jgi:hypothetical protein